MARKVIVAVTDAKKGAARVTADKEGYKSFIIPDNVGGRFSVLTPVGLLPIAVAGIDIDQLVEGARKMEEVCANENMMEIQLLSMLLHETNCIRAAKRLKSW